MKSLFLLLLVSLSPHAYIYKVTHGVVLFTYARDVYGSYAPYRKTIYIGNNSYDFFESTDELNISYASTCREADNRDLQTLINKDYTKRGIANNAALSKYYRKKSTDVGSVDYTLHSNYVYNKLNEDTLYIAYAFDGEVIKMDAPACENFLMIMHNCLVPSKAVNYPITFLYRVNEMYDPPKAFLDQLLLKKSQRNMIKVSYCE